jgi:hypothetical protein
VRLVVLYMGHEIFGEGLRITRTVTVADGAVRADA